MEWGIQEAWDPFSIPVPPRCRAHRGADDTVYGLVVKRQMSVAR